MTQTAAWNIKKKELCIVYFCPYFSAASLSGLLLVSADESSAVSRGNYRQLVIESIQVKRLILPQDYNILRRVCGKAFSLRKV
ncbi:hypothetical protein E2C01_087596 [Portunus trituberculatus]|uniref:Uncharacterized protein n=1 Tax=Portunus trituberculatus TaxID=210409 RepID=A0A5B7JJR2_PORTR|nr:hypothetical protein [Portunus trituberculatus]